MNQNPLLLLLWLLLLSLPGLSQTRDQWNTSSPGERFEVHDNLKREELTVVVFYSEKSEACQRFSQDLEALAQRDKGFKVGYLNIDRASAKTIDWTSPLARQYNLRAVPYVVVFEGKSKLAEGYDARKLLLERSDSIGR